MATCLSVKNKKKKKKKHTNHSKNYGSYSSLNGILSPSKTIDKYDEEYEWLQQQKLLISRVNTKPDQYLILSQKEIHDAINKALNKYPHIPMHWHWINGRFEPVIINNNFINNPYIISSYSDNCNHKHNHNHNHNHNHTNTHTQKQLLRMNGHYLQKCKSCFRKTMKHEYMTQKDILFLIKHSLKLFIEHRGNTINRPIYMARQPNILLSNIYGHTTHTQQPNDIFTENSISELSGIPIIRHNNSGDGYESNDKISHKSYGQNNAKIKLKKELNNLQKDYRSMLKDYNNLQNFLICKGIEYNYDYDKPINSNISSIDKLKTENSNLLKQLSITRREKSELENKYLLSRNEQNRLKNENIHLKSIICQYEQDEIHNNNNNNTYNTTPISHISDNKTSYSSSDDDDEVKMLQRVFKDDDGNNSFYSELTTLYDMNNNNNNNNNNEHKLSELNENNINEMHTSSILDILNTPQPNNNNNNNNNSDIIISRKTRSRSQSNSLLPVNSVYELRKEENLILQNEFDLFRLLIDDRSDKETLDLNDTIKARRGSIKPNYLGIDALIDHVTSQNILSIETLCNFLPLILFKSSKFEKEIIKNRNGQPSQTNYSLILISRLSKINRLWENDDIRQQLQFLSNSFRHNNNTNCKQIKNIFNNSYKIWLQKQKEKGISNNNMNNDLIIFWENILNLNENDIFNIDIGAGIIYRDPVIPNTAPLSSIKVCKELASANKPILCELRHQNNDISSHIILKKGDDLRKDYAIMNIFKYMNYIWKKERENNINNNLEFKNLKYENSIVKILTFNVVSISNDFGAIELISNCVPLRHVSNLRKNMKNEHFYQLITSAAASYIGSFVCGVRDRHFENILIRVADCTLFHIDFGYCVGETIKFALDASPFGITNQLKDLMNYGQNNIDLYNEKFIPICVDSFMALRKNYKSLIKFAQLAFSFIKKENDIENFIKNRLKIFDIKTNQKKYKKWNNKQYVKKWLEKKLKTAPKDNKTRRKNKLRKWISPTMVDLDKKLNLNNLNNNQL